MASINYSERLNPNVIGLTSNELQPGLTYTPIQQAVAEINPRFISYYPKSISFKRNKNGILASITTDKNLTLASYL